MKRNISLKVCAFFQKESAPFVLLQKAAQVLSEDGVDVSFTLEEEINEMEEEINEMEIQRIKEPAILAFWDTPEKAGRFAFSAGRAGKKGLSLYGGTPYGISLAEGNVFSFFQKEEFHSAFLHTMDWAFPPISDDALPKEGDPFLLSIYKGLMLYAAGKEDTLLGAMDRGRQGI